jgi:Cu(I)/Ag(I) efflux system membrane protein CusA/SilA
MIPSENGLLRGTVLLNVRGKDVIGFVEEARKAIANNLKLPAGYYIEWSGQYEDQQRARNRLLIALTARIARYLWCCSISPYHSFIEAAHVILARTFAAHRGGVYLLYALGYNFSVAVWVGFIAPFGERPCRQRMVMVIYLKGISRSEEGGNGRQVDSREPDQRSCGWRGAATETPKDHDSPQPSSPVCFTIMWSTSSGAEVMKPLATPVLGGMISSLVHVLIVTPVIFCWLHEHELKRDASNRRKPKSGEPAKWRRRGPRQLERSIYEEQDVPGNCDCPLLADRLDGRWRRPVRTASHCDA